MKKQMKRTVYEAPVTERFQVELEGCFCASVVKEQPQSGLETQGHELQDIDLSGETWNNSEWSSDN
mgnify:CR=1 FL=1